LLLIITAWLGSGLNQQLDLVIALKQQSADGWNQRNFAIAHLVQQGLYMVRELDHPIQPENPG
jgi:hypothetical protein